MKSAVKSKTDPAPAAPGPLAALDLAPDQEYLSLIGLLGAYSAACHRVEELQRMVNLALLAAGESIRDEHSALQGRIGAMEREMEAIAVRHPEWFAERKSIATPCGTVKQTSTTSLEPANEELAVQLLRKELPSVAEFYLRVSTSLNLEALETMTDEQLARFCIRRVRRESFSAVPVKANLGKVLAAPKKGAA